MAGPDASVAEAVRSWRLADISLVACAADARQHVFRQTASGWGFSDMLPLAELRNLTQGFLVHDTVQLLVKVTMRQADSIFYGSKKDNTVACKPLEGECNVRSALHLVHLSFACSSSHSQADYLAYLRAVQWEIPHFSRLAGGRWYSETNEIMDLPW